MGERLYQGPVRYPMLPGPTTHFTLDKTSYT